MQAFDYFVPDTLSQAIALLSERKGEARPLAGGTDLLPLMKQKDIHPKALVDLKKIKSLRDITYDPKTGLKIGALATHNDIIAHQDVSQHYPVLVQAAETIGSVQVRNRATVGGNLCHAVPSADMASPMLTLGTTAIIQGPDGTRRLPLEDFFVGPKQSALGPAEILVGLELPPPIPQSGAAFLKHGVRKAMEISIVCVSACVAFDGNGRICSSGRIALGAVAPTPLRAKKAEAILSGKALDKPLADQAGQMAAQEAQPITDLRGSAEYRRAIVQVLTSRALLQAAAGVKG